MMESIPEEVMNAVNEGRAAPTMHNAIPRDRIESDFSRHQLNAGGTAEAVAIRNAVKEAAHLMNRYCPPGRELSSALTKLEEAMFHATAGIARKGPIVP